MKQLLARALLLASSVALVALFAEAGLRLTRPWLAMPEFRSFGFPSRLFHHRYPPDARMHQPFGERHYVMQTNEDGLRTAYSRASFVAHERRIAMLGDSFTFGSTVEAEEAYPAVVEAALRERAGAAGAELAVLNAGIITYSPLLEQVLFDEVVRHYRPQLVVLALDVTDIGDDFHYAGQRFESGAFDVDEIPPRHPRYEHLALWNLAKPLRGRLASWLAAARKPERERLGRTIVVRGEPQRDRFFVMRYPLADTRPYFEATLRNVNALASRVRASGARFALVVGPRAFHWDLAESPDSWERSRYGDFETHRFEYIRFFEEAAARVDYPVLQLLPAFEASPVRPLAFRSDPHWNPDGHRVAGRALAEWLSSEGRLGLEP